MANLDFSCCAACGKCCHDLRLPLTRAEAIAWLRRGDTVEILCEALPWLEEPEAADRRAQYRRGRSFGALSGELPIRVVAILTAVHAGACPNLDERLRCSIYQERPHVCRIYPAEISPFIALAPASKLCPPEAWTAAAPLLRDDAVVDDEVRAHVAQSREADAREARWKRTLCANLGIGSAVLVNEGFAVHAPPLDRLLEALGQDEVGDGRLTCPSWTLVSNQARRVDALAAVGAQACLAPADDAGPVRYIGLP
ncbi:MAG: YkgJ family cysteine cluster protein [Xanthomonadaceae bacterium]|nr:YkgJ family cysteine cluster protein [Xanthomonadaceae bacterium]MDE2249097.1 YkgJ family cysteine cluster protein [Xanthomonadaceae bacterium]